MPDIPAPAGFGAAPAQLQIKLPEVVASEDFCLGENTKIVDFWEK